MHSFLINQQHCTIRPSTKRPVFTIPKSLLSLFVCAPASVTSSPSKRQESPHSQQQQIVIVLTYTAGYDTFCNKAEAAKRSAVCTMGRSQRDCRLRRGWTIKQMTFRSPQEDWLFLLHLHAHSNYYQAFLNLEAYRNIFSSVETNVKRGYCLNSTFESSLPCYRVVRCSKTHA